VKREPSFVFRYLIPIISLGLLLTSCAPAVVQHNNTGNERYAAGVYDEAIAEYRQAQVEEPDRPEPYYNAANAYNRQAQLDAALAQAQQALKTADPTLAARTWYNLGNAYFDAEQWPQAAAAYQQALRLNPDDLDAKHNLELALQKLEEQQQQEQEQQQQDQQEQQGQDQQGKENEQEGQESEGGDQSETGAATPTPASPAETSPGEEEQGAEAQETQAMTPEQALQLLQALIGEGETLQERLQEIYRVPGPPPEQDW
jgi:Ca-activated chloride channel family protein